LSYFQRYRKIAYDIQGIKDEGSDVILRYYVSESRHFICFQIKSYTDLRDSDYLRKIKAQYIDSQKTFDFVDYYLILATNEIEERKKLRLIKADLNPIPNLTIIDPSQFLFFWQLKIAQIGAIVKRFADEEDLLIQKTLELVAGLFKTQYYLIFFILDLSIRKGFSERIDLDDILYSDYLKEVYANFSSEEIEDEGEYMYGLHSNYYDSDNFKEMVEKDFNFLSDKYFDLDLENKKINPDYDYLRPILCLILEAQIKYEYNTTETVEYLEQLIFGIQTLGENMGDRSTLFTIGRGPMR